MASSGTRWPRPLHFRAVIALRLRRTGLAVLALATLTMVFGCRFEPGTVYRCGPGDSCDPGYTCEQGFCLPDGAEDSGTPDASDGGDAGAGEEDAGADAGDDGGTTEPTDGGDGGEEDAGPPLGTPLTWIVLRPITELNTNAHEQSPTISADQLKLCYHSDDTPNGDTDLFCAKRESRDAGFGTPWRQPASLDTVFDKHAELGPDGTELFFSSENGTDGEDVFRAVLDGNGDFVGRTLQTPLVADSYELSPSLSSDGLTLFFQSDRIIGNAADIWMASRDDLGAAWGAPTHLGEVAATEGEWEPAISPDGSYLLYTSERDAGEGVTGPIIYMSMRIEDGGFGPGRQVRLEGVDASIWGLELASDETLYFSARVAPNGWELFVARPVYDAGP